MIARAFTLYNVDKITHVENDMFFTFGFFDYFKTKNLDLDDDVIHVLWKYAYTIAKDRPANNCSYQNIFALTANDEMDKFMWDENNYNKYPLKILVMIQCVDYNDNLGLKDRKDQILSKIREGLGNEDTDSNNLGNYNYNMTYYYTLDRNDIIIAMGVRDYKKTMNAIKALNSLPFPICSYSITGVVKKLIYEDVDIEDINNEHKCYISKVFKEMESKDSEINSICIKGILDYKKIAPMQGDEFNKRMNNFNYVLKQALYGKLSKDNKIDSHMYDIMGEEDIRFIARNLKFSRLIGLMHKDSVLNTSDILLSSHTVINVRDDNTNKDSLDYIDEIEHKTHFVKYNFSEQVDRDIMEINKSSKISNGHIKSLNHLYKVLKSANETCSKNIYISLISAAFTEFAAFCRCEKYYNVSTFNELIKEYLVAFRNAIYSIMQSDIRFYRLADFNTDLCYPPLKLSTLYMLWFEKILNINKLFAEPWRDTSRLNYKCLVTFGQQETTLVKHIKLDLEDGSQRRLILCEIPEESIYMPQMTLVTLTHEASHFGFGRLRNREKRYLTFINILARAFIICFNVNLLSESNNRFMDEDITKSIKKQIIYNDNVSGKLYEYILYSFSDFRTKDDEYRKDVYSNKENSIPVKKEILYTENVDQRISDTIERSTYAEQEVRSLIMANLLNNIKRGINITDDFKKLHTHINAVPNVIEKAFLDARSWLSSIYEIYKKLISECFADIIAILLLKLDYESYKKAMITASKSAIEGKNGDFFVNFNHIRMHMVNQAFVECKEKNKVNNKNLAFWNRSNTSTDPIDKKINDFHAEIFTFFYKSDYKPEINMLKEIFTKDNDNFADAVVFATFKDKKISDVLTNYLSSCIINYTEVYEHIYNNESFSTQKDLFDTVGSIYKDLSSLSQNDSDNYIELLDRYISDFELLKNISPI